MPAGPLVRWGSPVSSSGWSMGDADPKASRTSSARGPGAGRLRWAFDAGGSLDALAEPLVTPDGRVLLSGSGSRGAVTVVLSPEGERLGELPGIGASGVTPVLSPQGLLFAPVGENQLVALAGESGQRRWTRELARRPDLLRGTPGGELLVFTREDRFLCVSRHGSPKWGALQDLTGAKGSALAAFDGEGNCYTAESAVVFRRGLEVTWQCGVSVLSPQGEERWSVVFEPTDAVDANGIRHILGLDRGAVFYGRTIQCREPAGELRWEIARPEELSRTVDLAGAGLTLAWDPRLLGGPEVVVVGEEGRFGYLGAAVDGEGCTYLGFDRLVLALDGEGRLRWRFELAEPVIGAPVIGPGGLLLVRSGGGLLAIG